MKARKIRLLVLLLLPVLAVLAIPSRIAPKVNAVCSTCPPPPPPPPTVGEFGGPLAGLSASDTDLFNGGYGTYTIKWDPIRGLGPVSTKTGCFTCHGAGTDVLTGTAGDTSTVTGTRYGKFNPDGTFNYLDGLGTFPENEGGPIVHGISNATFGTLPGCNPMTIAASPTGAVESGTTVTITTTATTGFKAGQMAQISGVGVAGYNGVFPIVSVPSSTTFTFTTTAGLAASGGGIAQNLPHEVVPADATVVSTVRSPNLFGLGLIDNIPDSAILANACPSTTPCKSFGIAGVPNMVADENGTIRPGRFGQKMDAVTLFQFTANAEYHELGITTNSDFFGISAEFNPNEHLPQGLPYPPDCQPDNNSPQDVAQVNMIKITQFNELLAPIPAQPATTQTKTGASLFISTGCSTCHMESFTTSPDVTLKTTTGGETGVVKSLSNVTFNPYSDFLLHDLGSGDSGGIPFQPEMTGQATLTMWRSSPLWGLSNTLAKAGGLMHDNASPTISAAILRHSCKYSGFTPCTDPGEAATVIGNYQALSSTDQADLLAFLGSL
jgi:Di-haem oxidoreductase, putative peroxidase